VSGASRLNRFDNDSRFNASNRNVRNDNALHGIAHKNAETSILMESSSWNRRDLWQELCSYENLELAFKKARKHKTLKPYVIEFEKNLKDNLHMLRTELLLHCYRPKPLETFIIRDPKTRKISKSDFRDRIIHHALCNIIEPIFEKTFIYDSYANRKGKGTLKALQRFDQFKRKISKNNTRSCYALKADVRKYFDNMHHETLIETIQKNIKDRRILRLIRIILSNHKTKKAGCGMPLGNLTSQFFANVYLSELDHFVKRKLRISHYIRYVDDFVILDNNKGILLKYKEKINEFLNIIKLELHPDKSKIRLLNKGITFLGFRIFNCHKLLKKNNIANMKRRVLNFKALFDNGLADYNGIYSSMEGWLAYAINAHTYALRKRFVGIFESIFQGNVADAEIARWMKAES